MSAYTEEMKKTLLDKCFFIDKTDATLFVDFGCADGTMLKFIRDIFGGIYQLIGYDNNPEMVELARQQGEGIHFFSRWNEVVDQLRDYKKEHPDTKTAIVLSSVVHEVYSYCQPEEIEEFWGRVWSDDFDYVCVRDMMPNAVIDRPAEADDEAKVRAKAEPDKLREFEEVQGPVTRQRNLVHYLLKYRYSLNWQREVSENYIPLNTQQFRNLIPAGYEIDYDVEYLLPFIKRKVLEDFGIALKDSTHLKVVVRRISSKNPIL